MGSGRKKLPDDEARHERKGVGGGPGETRRGSVMGSGMQHQDHDRASERKEVFLCKRASMGMGAVL